MAPGSNLHKEDKHPLNTIKQRIEHYFANKYKTEDNKPLFNIYDSFKPVVSVKVRYCGARVDMVTGARH
jgi:hypothetical protein